MASIAVLTRAIRSCLTSVQHKPILRATNVHKKCPGNCTGLIHSSSRSSAYVTRQNIGVIGVPIHEGQVGVKKENKFKCFSNFLKNLHLASVHLNYSFTYKSISWFEVSVRNHVTIRFTPLFSIVIKFCIITYCCVITHFSHQLMFLNL